MIARTPRNRFSGNYQQPIRYRQVLKHSGAAGRPERATPSSSSPLHQALNQNLAFALARSVQNWGSFHQIALVAAAGIMSFGAVVWGALAFTPASALPVAGFLSLLPASAVALLLANGLFRYLNARAFNFEGNRLGGGYFPLVSDFLQLQRGVRKAHEIRDRLNAGRLKYPEHLVRQFAETLHQAEAQLMLRYRMLTEVANGKMVTGAQHFSGEISILVDLKLAKLGAGQPWYPEQWDAA